jgi:hypothetical protein
MNAALTAARQFYENCYRSRARQQGAYSERLTDSGVMLRGPGCARWPAEV